MSQIAEFHAAVLQSLPELTSWERQYWIGEGRPMMKSGVSFFKLPDIHVYIERSSVVLHWPGWKKEVFHPDLQFTGPSDYSLGSLEPSLHPKQEAGGIATGHEVYEHQQSLGLDGCLGLADLQAIQKLGLATFRRYFQKKAVFGWKSVIQNGDGEELVPFLVGRYDQVRLHWILLFSHWNAQYLALRFAK